MDSIVINPSFRVLNLSPLQHKTINKPLSSSLIHSFNCSVKIKRSPISVHHKPQSPIRKCNNYYSFGAPVLNLLSVVKDWVCGGSPEGYLQNGGLGVALLSVTATAKVRISPFVVALAANPTFVSAFFAWLIAQSVKVMLNFWVERKWDWRLMCASGGMPSAHSALCTALTTSVAICHGVSDSLFPVCLGFSSIVMYDAIGVRRHAGMQAEVLNMIVEDLFQGHPISQRKLKELLGHTPLQVFAGAVLGIAVACFFCKSCFVGT